MPNTIHQTPQWASNLAADIGAAQQSITLTAISYLHPRKLQGTPHAELGAAIFSAAARGKRVEIILPATSTNHPATAQNNSQAAYLAAHNIRVTLTPMPRLLHAKTALIDDAIAWIGSGNFTAAACNHNHELYIRTTDIETTVALHIFHNALKGTH